MKSLRHLLVLSLVLAGCAEVSTAKRSIGEAIMRPDGTIQMTLRAEMPGGGVGDGFLQVGPQDPRYEMIRQHIGLQRPGVSMPVPPFDDTVEK